LGIWALGYCPGEAEQQTEPADLKARIERFYTSLFGYQNSLAPRYIQSTMANQNLGWLNFLEAL
jgi:hypothetical protein